MIQGELRFPEQFAAYLLFGQCRVLQGSGQYRLLIYPVLILPNASRWCGKGFRCSGGLACVRRSPVTPVVVVLRTELVFEKYIL